MLPVSGGGGVCIWGNLVAGKRFAKFKALALHNFDRPGG